MDFLMIMNSIKYLGTFPVMVIVAGCLFLWESKQLSYYFLRMTACTYGFSCFMKEYVRRDRPYVVDPSVLKVPLHDMTNPHRSFPSGHTAVISIMCLVLFQWYREQYHSKLAYLFLIPIPLVAFSRVYIGAHYISDCLAGFILAFGILYSPLGEPSQIKSIKKGS